MINLFEGLGELGFKDTVNLDLFKSKEKPKAKKVGIFAVNPEDILYLKEFECPVCDHKFKNSVVKVRTAKHIKSDTDLRMYFDPIDPMYYDIILCPYCGYASRAATFSHITQRQADKIIANITPKYKPREYSVLLSLDDAIERYKMALLNCFIKDGKDGEKAYLCLKLAWLYRVIPDKEREIAYLENAKTGFEKAYVSENFPICGIDETTMVYMLADISRRIGQNDVSMRYLSRIMGDKNVPQRIKDKAIEIKELIREDEKASAAKTSTAPCKTP